MRRRTCTAVVLALLAAPTAAWGHAEWRPAEVVGGTTRGMTLFVPPEKPGVENVRIDLEVRPGFSVPSCDPPPGWSCAAPDGATVVSFEQQVRIASESRFDLELTIPETPGEVVFAVTQTYDDGTGVRWAGPRGDEFEGAILRVTTTSPGPSPTAPRSPTPGAGPSLAPPPDSPSPSVMPSPQPSSAASPSASASPLPSATTPAAETEPPAAVVLPRTPGRFVVPAAQPSDDGLGDRVAALVAGGLLLAAMLGHLALATRRVGSGRA